MSALAEAIKAAVGVLTGVVAGGPGARMLRGLWPGAASPPPTRGTRERLHAYGNTPWLHAVADKVSSAFAAVPWKLYVVRRGGAGPALPARTLQRAAFADRRKALDAARDHGDLVEVQDHPLHQAIDAANP